MKIKSILVAALAALTLAACSKDGENGEGNPVPEGGPTRLSLSITLPQAALRAGETQDATQKESAIEDVDIYIFNYNGTPASKNPHVSLSVSTDFDPISGGVYKMRSAIETTSGDKIVYVAANLPASISGLTFATESELTAKLADVDDLVAYDAGGDLESIVMWAKAEKTFVIKEFGDNEVDVELERAVSRVVTTADDDVFTKSWSAAGADDLTVTITQYFLAQDVHTSYLVPHYYPTGFPKSLIDGKAYVQFGDVINKYDPSDYPVGTTPDYVSIVADPGSNRQTLDGFYIGENIPNNPNDVARYGNTTYAFIQTQWELDNGAAVTGTIGSGATITYTGTAIDGTTGFFLVRANGVDYICHEDELDDVTDCLQADYNLDADDIYVYEFKKSYVYYRVYLNREQEGTEKYNVFRNQFTHIDVADLVVTPNSFGGGYPGDTENPEVPIDPNDEDEDNNPNPWTPGPDPIDEDDATLVVNISVKKWMYSKNPTILE